MILVIVRTFLGFHRVTSAIPYEVASLANLSLPMASFISMESRFASPSSAGCLKDSRPYASGDERGAAMGDWRNARLV